MAEGVWFGEKVRKQRQKLKEMEGAETETVFVVAEGTGESYMSKEYLINSRILKTSSKNAGNHIDFILAVDHGFADESTISDFHLTSLPVLLKVRIDRWKNKE